MQVTGDTNRMLTGFEDRPVHSAPPTPTRHPTYLTPLLESGSSLCLLPVFGTELDEIRQEDSEWLLDDSGHAAIDFNCVITYDTSRFVGTSVSMPS